MKLLFLFLLAVQIYATEITKVVGISEEWKGATEKNCKGLYWEVATEVFALSNIKLECKLAPYARGVKLVEKKKVDFWVGSYENEESFPYYPEVAISADNVSVLYDTTRQTFNNLEDIKNKKVAWIRDYDYDKYIDIQMNIKEIKDKKNLKIKTLMELKTYMAFARNNRGKELTKLWDKNMRILDKSGKLKEVFNRYHDSDFYPF